MRTDQKYVIYVTWAQLFVAAARQHPRDGLKTNHSEGLRLAILMNALLQQRGALYRTKCDGPINVRTLGCPWSWRNSVKLLHRLADLRIPGISIQFEPAIRFKLDWGRLDDHMAALKTGCYAPAGSPDCNSFVRMVLWGNIRKQRYELELLTEILHRISEDVDPDHCRLTEDQIRHELSRYGSEPTRHTFERMMRDLGARLVDDVYVLPDQLRFETDLSPATLEDSKSVKVTDLERTRIERLYARMLTESHDDPDLSVLASRSGTQREQVEAVIYSPRQRQQRGQF